jgi:hypothetical protein
VIYVYVISYIRLYNAYNTCYQEGITYRFANWPFSCRAGPSTTQNTCRAVPLSETKTSWNAGARSARDVAPSAPHQCPRWAHTAHRPYAVTAWSTRWPSWPGPRPRAHAPRALCRWPSRAVWPPSLATRSGPRVAARLAEPAGVHAHQ